LALPESPNVVAKMPGREKGAKSSIFTVQEFSPTTFAYRMPANCATHGAWAGKYL
jgi:hypothetical protein